MRPLQERTDFYRKFVGLVQLSSIPLTLKLVPDGIVIDFPDHAMVQSVILTQQEWEEWSTEQILNTAGVQLNDIPEVD